jgi:hypothetical protein
VDVHQVEPQETRGMAGSLLLETLGTFGNNVLFKLFPSHVFSSFFPTPVWYFCPSQKSELRDGLHQNPISLLYLYLLGSFIFT